MAYLIRKVETQDLLALVELCRKHAEYEQAEYDSATKQELLSSALFDTPPKLYCWVVEHNKQLVGYTSYTFDFSTWDAATFLYLDCLYLEPSCRGLGIGEEIMYRLKQVAQHNNCVNIQWQTPYFNTGAIKFYKRIGGVGKEKVRFLWNLSDV